MNCSLVKCISIVFLRINDNMVGYFSYGKDDSQEDSLSLLIFCLAE